MEYSERRAELIDWIAETVTDFNDEPRYTQEQLEKMSGGKLLGIWLEWKGICGYTGQMSIMSHLSDAQELLEIGVLKQEIQNKINFAKQLVLTYPDTTIEVSENELNELWKKTIN